jgi:hypothetical protein
LALLLGLTTSFTLAAEPARRTILYDNATTEVRADTERTKDLWVTLADLTKAAKWEVKPEGVCSAKECIPIPAARKKEFLAERAGETWFNLSEFARLLKQPAAHDAKNDVWYFGARPEAQNAYLASLSAPDFQLPDHTGKPRSLSELRGKKVLLLTWASW